MHRPVFVPLLLALALGGCANLAPDYQRPQAPVADQWPAQAESTSGNASAEIDWRSFFIDARLEQVVERALANNRDLRVAALNIEKARAQYRIQRAEQFPSVAASVSGTRSRTPASLNGGEAASIGSQYSAELGFSSYELDFFGRLKNLSESALEDYLALEETHRSTQISLVAEVANAWLTLAADKTLLQLAEDTLKSQQASYELTRRSHDLGNSSGVALAQAQSTVESAREDVAEYTSQVRQDINALTLLVGDSVPDTLLPATLDAEAAQLVEIPAGLPSSLLQRRPDVLAAEHDLKAANADIGAARAALFPSITLTGAAGTSSADLSGLFKSGSGAWSFAPSISVPIFNAGSLRASLESAKTEKAIQLATYEKTVQSAFREVADALAVRSTLQDRLNAQRALVEATERSYRLSDALYRNGANSYLEVLDAQRSLYSARQGLISLELSEQANRLTLYKVLGGGASTERQAGNVAS
ncbi:AdeC/AdeK/OprM family multidrug efflux complex outer membrane factor [Pseudomonas indica]|uniref:AdeC/AdeK/OprM family multidrug efflux complex outer membrane factor n=1 Tax=Pseudomonas indica TaxID=137658 RepID=UPI000BAB2A9D|nr:AdeC/AdeK/OprM family multidrug efflux complex outer membrane factor [Pseudomonas indica]PAU61076.1 transporter [Pseudomonas indica]